MAGGHQAAAGPDWSGCRQCTLAALWQTGRVSQLALFVEILVVDESAL